MNLYIHPKYKEWVSYLMPGKLIDAIVMIYVLFKKIRMPEKKKNTEMIIRMIPSM